MLDKEMVVKFLERIAEKSERSYERFEDENNSENSYLDDSVAEYEEEMLRMRLTYGMIKYLILIIKKGKFDTKETKSDV